MQEEHVDGLLDHHEPRSSHHVLPFVAERTTEGVISYGGGRWRLKTTRGSPSFPRSSAWKDRSSGAVLGLLMLGSRKEGWPHERLVTWPLCRRTPPAPASRSACRSRWHRGPSRC